MARTFEKIPDEFVDWIEGQPVFFVATAPADPGTHVNVSPRGLDTFRVIDANRVAWLDRDERGDLVRKAGIMGVVVSGGEVRPGDAVRVELPSGSRRPLEKV